MNIFIVLFLVILWIYGALTLFSLNKDHAMRNVDILFTDKYYSPYEKPLNYYLGTSIAIMYGFTLYMMYTDIVYLKSVLGVFALLVLLSSKKLYKKYFS